MKRKCSQWEQLAKMVRKLILLSRRNQTETNRMKELYMSIRDVCLVEVYRMPMIRKMVSDEEMSGFIIEFDSSLKEIVMGYDPEKSPFWVYLMYNAEFKACNYMRRMVKSARMERAVLNDHLAEFYEDKWEIDYDSIAFGEKSGLVDKRAVKALRYICCRRKSFQRRLFIFICTMMTSIPATTLESMCRCFGFDEMQTFAINEFIFDETIGTQRMADKDLYTQKRNRNWSMMLYYKSQFAADGDNAPDEYEKENLKSLVDMYAHRLEIANKHIEEKKFRVKYSTVGDILGISEGTVSTSVFVVRNVLEAVVLGRNLSLENKSGDGIMDMIDKSRTSTVKDIPQFKPFEAFGMDCKRWSNELSSPYEDHSRQLE